MASKKSSLLDFSLLKEFGEENQWLRNIIKRQEEEEMKRLMENQLSDLRKSLLSPTPIPPVTNNQYNLYGSSNYNRVGPGYMMSTVHQTPGTDFRNTNNSPRENSTRKKRTAKSRIEILVERQKQLNKKTTTQGKKIDFSNIEIDLTGRLELSNTLFDSLTLNGEIFLYSNNKLYTLGSPAGENEEGSFLSYKGKAFRLEESESLLRLESDFLDRNRDNIRKFQKESLDKLSKQYNKLRDRILSLKEALDDKFSIEEFIADYIFALYHKRKISNSSEYDDIDLLGEIFSERTEVEEISFSRMKKSVLEKLVNDVSGDKKKRLGGLIILCGNVYGFFPIGAVSRLRKRKQISLNEAFYIDSLERFNEKYKEKLRGEIKNRVKRSFSSELLKIKEGEERIRILNKRKKRNIKSKEGDMGFSRISDNEYLIYRELPRYIIKKNGGYYLFPEVKIGTRLILNGEKISFDTDGRVETTGYNHLFVYPSGRICYGESNYKQKRILGIEQSKYRLINLNKKRFAIDILKVLDFTESILTKGYAKKTIPVIPLKDFSSRKISERRARELSRNGIKIYDNDRRTI